MNKNNQKGFSLVELLVVVAIIGILAAVGVVTYNGYIGNARISAAKASHNSIVAFATAEAAKCSIAQDEKFTTVLCKTIIDDANPGTLLGTTLETYIDKNYDHTFDSTKKDDAVSDVDALTCTTAAHAGDIRIGVAKVGEPVITVSTCVDTAGTSMVSGDIGIY